MQQKTQLFIFPHAGGSDLSYLAMEKSLSSGFDVCTICYPGRSRRYTDVFARNMDELVKDSLSILLSKYNGGNFFIMGHSFGALVAFECMKMLQSQQRKLPNLAILSGKQAPSYRSTETPKHTLDDVQLVDFLKGMGGLPQELAENPSFLSFYLPIIRNDLALNETYEYKNAMPLNVPIVLVNGTEDKDIKPSAIEAWQQETSQKCEIVNMSGGHFFNLENAYFINLMQVYNEKYSYAYPSLYDTLSD